MVISVVLDTEYMGVSERNKWFLKSVSNAMKEDTVIITHSYFKDHLTEIVNGCADRFYNEFEMDRVKIADIEKLDICYIPDELFDNIYKEAGSRTKQLIYLFNERVPSIEEYIIRYIDEALTKRCQSKPEYILNCLHTFESIKYLSTYYQCPLIPYVFSAIRKVHGYAQTLYMAHIDTNLFNSHACEKLYQSMEEKDLGFPVLDKKEILSLIGKKSNFALLPLIDREGCYQVGVVGEGFHIIPEVYQIDAVTDDDIYYACKCALGKDTKIITRQHPLQLDQIGFGRSHMKNDPAAFLLSCNRVVTVQSQMIMKAAMWNRAAITMSNALPYSCLLNRNIADAHAICDFDLNFILFVYFIPDSCMFSSEYWRWRFSNPSVKEIAIHHMQVIMENLNIPFSVLQCDEDRIDKILACRGLEQQQIQRCLFPESTEDVPYDYPTASFKFVTKTGDVISMQSLNHKDGEYLITSIDIPKECVKCSFIPQNDLDGYISMKNISVSGKEQEVCTAEKYYSKNEPVTVLDLDGSEGLSIKAVWRIRRFE